MATGDLKLALVKSCPICGGPIDRGFLGTNGRVFWSEDEEHLRVFGDDVLIPIAIFTTNYVDSIRCRTCDFYAFRP